MSPTVALSCLSCSAAMELHFAEDDDATENDLGRPSLSLMRGGVGRRRKEGGGMKRRIRGDRREST